MYLIYSTSCSPNIFKNYLFETHLPKLDVHSTGTQNSGGLFTEMLLGLK